MQLITENTVKNKSVCVAGHEGLLLAAGGGVCAVSGVSGAVCLLRAQERTLHR